MDTAGHCCWPGQAWSTSRKQCVGAPSCAAGWRVEKESCVAGEPAAPLRDSPPPPPPPPPPGPAPLSAGQMPLPPPAPLAGDPEITPLPRAEDAEVTAAPTVVTRKRFRVGMIIAGGGMFVGGFILSALLAFAGSQGDFCAASVATYGWIPVIGPTLGITNQTGRMSGGTPNKLCTTSSGFVPMVIFAGVETALQLAGLVVLGLGFIPRDVPVEANAAQPNDLKLVLSAGAPGSPLGVTLRLINW